jgi:NodT family efflux transporter outer membrane factor (OMF) lipoprotein
MKIFCTLLVVAPAGCTGPFEYVHNRFKVGPDYEKPCTPVANEWIDDGDKRVRTDEDDLEGWWTVFDDELLNEMMVQVYEQNLTLREAGYRILAARAQLGIVVGEFFPQSQNANGSYRRFGVADTFFDQWNFNFNLVWELDFWGRFRRAIQAAEATLDASVFEYNDVLVTLLSDTAEYYVQARTTQEQIRLLDANIRVQEDVLRFIKQRLQTGRAGVTTIDHAQALSNLEQSRSQRNQLQINLRTFENQLCILMGMPAVDLTELMASGPKTSIPVAPDYVVVGIPADLLRRRPDVRRAERLAAAQAELIGIAEADWYPAISINGTLGWQAQRLSDLFTPQSFNSSVGPSFQWNLLNYGRILNNVRLQDARFCELVTAYQSTVLQADLEVENGIVTFIQAHQRAKDLESSVEQAWTALDVLAAQYVAGLAGVDFNRYATIQQTLITQQDQWAQSRGQIALGLIQVYRGLGGGWQIKCNRVPDKRGILSPPIPSDSPAPVEELPAGTDSQTNAPAIKLLPPTSEKIEALKQPSSIVDMKAPAPPEVPSAATGPVATKAPAASGEIRPLPAFP